MKVFYKYIAILIMACGSVFLFSSCDNDDDVKKSSSEIIGKWKYEEYGDDVLRLTIQFKTDNTFTCTDYYYDSYYDEYEYETWKGIYEYDKETKIKRYISLHILLRVPLMRTCISWWRINRSSLPRS